MSDPTESKTWTVGYGYNFFPPPGTVMCITDDQPTPPGWKRLSARMYALSDDGEIESMGRRFIVKE